MITCKECGAECLSGNSITFHLKRDHMMSYADYLIKHEHGGKQPTCKCGKLIPYKAGGFTRFCSKSCASSGEDNAMGRLKGEKSPNFGQRRTPEQRLNYSKGARKRWSKHGDKLRAMMRTDEYRQAQSDANTQSYASSPDRAERVSRGGKKWWQNHPEARVVKRDLAVRLLEEGKIGPQAPFKARWVLNPFTGKQEYMHSSWETSFLEHCCEVGVEVTKSHSIRIPYRGLDGNEHIYVPDFITIEGYPDRLMFEIKGQRDMTDDLKESVARTWCTSNGYELIVVGNRSDTIT